MWQESVRKSDALNRVRMKNTVDIRGTEHYVCYYTGAVVPSAFFLPDSGTLRRDSLPFSCLPVLLRHLRETLEDDEYQGAKEALEEFYVQPDIPLAPPLAANRTPMTNDEFLDYLLNIEQGLAWLRVPTVILPAEIAQITPHRKRRKK